MSNENSSVAWQILEMIETVQDAAAQMLNACLNNTPKLFESLSEDILLVFQSFMPIIQDYSKAPTLFLACESILDSLKRIGDLHHIDAIKCAHKIEFELIPLIQTFYMNYYLFVIAVNDEKLLALYLERDRFQLGANIYVDRAEETGEYKYELSICVIGYNKLDYTKLCIENLLKNIPKDLNYELLLINHGSTDGTKEFFESIAPDKQLDIFRNGGGLEASFRIIEGKYVLSISNDVIVTENAIANMLACIKQDSRIAYVVPTTANVSNNQTITDDFTNMDDMFSFAAKNNQLDPLKWEQRSRLCDPLAMLPANHHFSTTGMLSSTYKLSEDIFLFPDDKNAYMIRKRGLKMILAKDSYCFHFGSATLGHKSLDSDYYIDGRKAFHKEFGIDPWGKGFCYDHRLFQNIKFQKKHDAKILGVSPGMGSNPLKAKTLLRELGSKNTKLFLASEDEQFQIDYESYTKIGNIEITPVENFTSVFAEEQFDYIFVETNIGYSEVNAFLKRLNPDGMLFVWCGDSKAEEMLQRQPPTKKIPSGLFENGVWYLYT